MLLSLINHFKKLFRNASQVTKNEPQRDREDQNRKINLPEVLTVFNKGRGLQNYLIIKVKYMMVYHTREHPSSTKHIVQM